MCKSLNPYTGYVHYMYVRFYPITVFGNAFKGGLIALVRCHPRSSCGGGVGRSMMPATGTSKRNSVESISTGHVCFELCSSDTKLNCFRTWADPSCTCVR